MKLSQCLKSRLSKTFLVLAILSTSVVAVAGIHAYTHGLKITNLMWQLIYFQELGQSIVGIFLG